MNNELRTPLPYVAQIQETEGGPKLALRLYRDENYGETRYRWYEVATDADTEVSSGATVEDAIQIAMNTWGHWDISIAQIGEVTK